MRTLIVTGANGYIGRHLVNAARDARWRVVAATRAPVQHADAWLPYRLDVPLAEELVPAGAVIVHLAAIPGAAAGMAMEVAAADRLVELARTRGARLVFVSSQTAREDAPTEYGRSKWQIQRRVLAAGGSVVRPGLVYGGSPGGLYATLLRWSRARWLPRLVPAPRVQPVHVEDLVLALLTVAQRADLAGETFDVASAVRVPFDVFLRAIAIGRHGRAPRFVPLPALFASTAGRMLSAAGVGALGARLVSLMDLPAMEPTRDLARLGVVLRALEDGVGRHHPDRRALVREGSALLEYVLGRRAPLGPRRRYARAIEAVRDGRALPLPAFALAWPAALRMLDQRSWLRTDPHLDERIVLAVTIADASREGAARFLPTQTASSAAIVVARLAGTVLLEGFARLASFAARVVKSPPRHDP